VCKALELVDCHGRVHKRMETIGELVGWVGKDHVRFDDGSPLLPSDNLDNCLCLIDLDHVIDRIHCTRVQPGHQFYDPDTIRMTP
jgi:hypothetical protein